MGVIIFYLSLLIDLPTIFTLAIAYKVKSLIKIILAVLILTIVAELIIGILSPTANHHLFLDRLLVQELLAVSIFFSKHLHPIFIQIRNRNRNDDNQNAGMTKPD